MYERFSVHVSRFTVHLTHGFEFLKRVQEAFYAMNRDVTAPELLADIAQGCGVNREQFAVGFKTEETARATWRDFETSRRLGVTGFPSLLAGNKESGFIVITAGYRPWKKVKVYQTQEQDKNLIVKRLPDLTVREPLCNLYTPFNICSTSRACPRV
ncbi:MAG: DsbA family protein [bacterium]|nr:DsbA family protein [bacterium]MDT8367328.1 DsbA family protein [bacterium]